MGCKWGTWRSVTAARLDRCPYPPRCVRIIAGHTTHVTRTVRSTSVRTCYVYVPSRTRAVSQGGARASQVSCASVWRRSISSVIRHVITKKAARILGVGVVLATTDLGKGHSSLQKQHQLHVRGVWEHVDRDRPLQRKGCAAAAAAAEHAQIRRERPALDDVVAPQREPVRVAGHNHDAPHRGRLPHRLAHGLWGKVPGIPSPSSQQSSTVDRRGGLGVRVRARARARLRVSVGVRVGVRASVRVRVRVRVRLRCRCEAGPWRVEHGCRPRRPLLARRRARRAPECRGDAVLRLDAPRLVQALQPVRRSVPPRVSDTLAANLQTDHPR